MNSLNGKITSIDLEGSLALIGLNCSGISLKTIVLGFDGLSVGDSIQVQFKETEVIIAHPGALEVSLQNRLQGTISAIEKGKLLSRVVLQTSAGTVSSVITTRAVDQLQLELGKSALALVKTNEILLAK